MMGLLRHPLFGIVAGAALLTGILGWMVLDRVRLLAGGREIELAIRPVDPRDLFKGDYVQLALDITQLDPKLFIAGQVLEPGRPGDQGRAEAQRTIFVTLEQQADQSWHPAAVSRLLPAGLPANRIVLRGRTHPWNPNAVAYGLERYYVPEGTGGHIEGLARASKLSAIVAVDRSGRAAIKGLVHEGKRIYEEPLF